MPVVTFVFPTYFIGMLPRMLSEENKAGTATGEDDVEAQKTCLLFTKVLLVLLVGGNNNLINYHRLVASNLDLIAHNYSGHLSWCPSRTSKCRKEEEDNYTSCNYFYETCKS